jgi:hypothetical protein
MDDFFLCADKDCWCVKPVVTDQIEIAIDRQIAIELAKLTSTHAPLIKEVALACELALRIDEESK